MIALVDRIVQASSSALRKIKTYRGNRKSLLLIARDEEIRGSLSYAAFKSLSFNDLGTDQSAFVELGWCVRTSSSSGPTRYQM